jgi:hypothetical protein
MKHRYITLTFMLLLTASAHAIVIRHDVDDAKYRVDSAPAGMIDMPYQGHGILIAPEWILTPAHVVFGDYKGKTIRIGERDYQITHVIFHPGYAKPEEGLFTGDAARSQAFLEANHDVALLKLAEPVEDIEPMWLYMGTEEMGHEVTFWGKGNTGDGIRGELSKSGGTLRMAKNRIHSVSEQWIAYRFDRGNDALPLEGIQGNGDSGGPAVITIDGTSYVVGLASWDIYEGDLSNFKGGIYGMGAKLVRMSYYADWIAEVQQWSDEKLDERHYKMGW